MLNGQEYAEYINEQRINQGRPPYFNGSTPKRPALESIGEGINYQDEAYQIAPMQNHQLTVSGGNEQTQYAISGNYFDQEGIIKNSRFLRGSFRVNLDQQV
jgi:hypothetical protein